MTSHQCGVAEKPPAVSYELRREGKAPPVFIAGELADPKAVELARAVPDVEDRQLLEVCKDWLARFLADGEKLVATILVEGKKLGFSDRTIYRAKKALDVKHRGEGQGGNYRSYWHLP